VKDRETSMHPSFEVTQATVVDAAEILEIQKAAYMIEAEIYDDFTIPPLLQTLEEIRAEFERMLILKAVLEQMIVGSVRAYSREETCFVGRLIVRPEFQDRGIGTSLLNEIERRFPDVRRFELFTGHKSERNLHLYKKLGYRPFRTEEIHPGLSLVYLEKTRGHRL
jgi:ribosomal protein S18 acetylase RimI-like enzyme